MVRCWKYDPRDRPTFAQIVLILQRHADDVLTYPDEEFREVFFYFAPLFFTSFSQQKNTHRSFYLFFATFLRNTIFVCFSSKSKIKTMH